MHCSDRKSEIEQPGSDNESRIREIVRERRLKLNFVRKLPLDILQFSFN